MSGITMAEAALQRNFTLPAIEKLISGISNNGFLPLDGGGQVEVK